MQLIKAASQYLKNGISVIPTGSDKRALFSWKKYQEERLSIGDLSNQFTQKAKGIAVICGQISGNLEVIDVDTKYDLDGTLFENLMAAIHDALPEVSDKLLIIQTKNFGKHLYYRCDEIGGNQKLAQRNASEEELKSHPNEKVLVLIETRGEGGYVVAPPSEGYKKIAGEDIPTITPAEREILLEICRSFNQYTIEEVKPLAVKRQQDGFAVTPWDDYNNRGIDDMLQRLENHGWQVVKRTSDKVIFKRPGNTDSKSSGDYCYSKNLFSVFTTSSVFEPIPRAYKPSSVFAILEHNGNFSNAGKALVQMGYGEKPVNFGKKVEQRIFQKKTEGYSHEDLVRVVKTDLKLETDEEAEKALDDMNKKWGEKICTFWDVTIDSEGKKRININKKRFNDFLHEVGGFGLYFYDKNSTIYRIVRVKDGFVEESSIEQMKKFIMNYVSELPLLFDHETTPDALMEMIIQKHSSLFNEGAMEFLPHVEIDFLKDDKDCGYFPFKNGVVVVDKNKVWFKTYDEINKVIWKNQVKDFYITLDQNFAPDSCEYYRFLEKISGDEDDRLHYCISLVGYLLHRFKDPARPFAVVLAEETESDKDGGGTGKGIFIKAIAELLRTIKVDGKNFKIDKNFSMQRVSLDTQLIAIEDCDRNLDFEKFNSQITEGSTVEKKNKDELFIDYKDSPKFIFTTNYTLNVKGNHGKRRSKIFEFAPFFGPTNTPIDFFGHLLFEAWDEDEWNRFYNLLFFCLSIYLSKGIMEVKSSEKIKRKQIKLQFGEEFMEWWDEFTEAKKGWKFFGELYTQFMNENDFEKKEYSQKRYKKAIEVASEVFGYEVVMRKNSAASGKKEIKLEKVPGMVYQEPDSKLKAV